MSPSLKTKAASPPQGPERQSKEQASCPSFEELNIHESISFLAKLPEAKQQFLGFKVCLVILFPRKLFFKVGKL